MAHRSETAPSRPGDGGGTHAPAGATSRNTPPLPAVGPALAPAAPSRPTAGAPRAAAATNPAATLRSRGRLRSPETAEKSRNMMFLSVRRTAPGQPSPACAMQLVTSKRRPRRCDTTACAAGSVPRKGATPMPERRDDASKGLRRFGMHHGSIRTDTVPAMWGLCALTMPTTTARQ
jgi:hypothetical protein